LLTGLSQPEFTNEQIEIMARAAHEAFCAGLISQGYRYGPEIDAGQKSHPALVAYDELSESLKEASRATVRDIPRKLRLLGWRIEPGNDQEGIANFSEGNLERLAQLEHQRWMEHKLGDGWTYGPETDPGQKVHASLVEWDELSEEERQKDREMIRSIPKILAEAGYVIVAD
jgi:hypothetical protein